MICQEITITNPTGLHTRPAKLVVAQAKQFECSVTVSRDGKDADLKSLIKLMKLGISQNHRITLCCDGPDESQAMAALTAFIQGLED